MGPQLPLLEGVARVALAFLLGGVVGLEREFRDHDAGLRTHMLVGAGAALFVVTGDFAWSGLDFGNRVGIVLDPSRVIAYVVTGVGFLGAGAIMKNGGSVRGLTTAASLWVVAAIGVTVGSGMYWLGLFATAIVLVSLWPVKRLVHLLGPRRRSRKLMLDLGPETPPGEVIRLLRRSGLHVVASSVAAESTGRTLELVVTGRQLEVDTLIDRVLEEPAVRRISIAA